ncbi:MAG: hypothetical protein WC390_12420 [Sulfurimonas sp.]|jgi:hypothetical protein
MGNGDRPKIQVDLSGVDNSKTKIVAAMYNIGQPVRQTDLVKEMGMSPQLIDYHIKELIEKNVISIVEDDNGFKYYVLSEVFYDESLFEGIRDALYPLADAVSQSIHVGDTKVVVENSKYLVELFWSLFDLK